MKVDIFDRTKNGFQICILLEPERIQDFLRWLRNNDVKPPSQWYPNYDGHLSLGSFFAPEKIAEKLKLWSELENL